MKMKTIQDICLTVLKIIYMAFTMIFYNCLIFIYITNEIKHDPAKYLKLNLYIANIQRFK